MSREKQIEKQAVEEMANFLWKNTIIHTEDLCHDVSETCYNAGYRKQSEGEWIPKHHISRSPRGRYISYNTYSCDVCGKPNGRQKTPFCPKCGAKMKGGAE